MFNSYHSATVLVLVNCAGHLETEEELKLKKD